MVLSEAHRPSPQSPPNRHSHCGENQGTMVCPQSTASPSMVFLPAEANCVPESSWQRRCLYDSEWSSFLKEDNGCVTVVTTERAVLHPQLQRLAEANPLFSRAFFKNSSSLGDTSPQHGFTYEVRFLGER
ncbi:hypothetical protein CRENBAI_018402 [Crenichthys baileyi]|uniref:Uncharacterized protein n=1 Tax=Crenichthys baileyi TaxID=28760 RepID=A0AAV9QWW3_9TELE